MIDMVPTFTTSNERICLLMTNGQMGSLRIEDAERLQVLLCCAVLCCAVLCCKSYFADYPSNLVTLLHL